MRPGGEEEGRTACLLEEEERTNGNQSNPPNCFPSLCKMGTAIVLPLCWGKKTREHGGLPPTERGHGDRSAPTAPSHFAESRGGSELACVHVHCPATPGSLWLMAGGCGDPRRGVSSLPHQLPTSTIRWGHCISRVTLGLASPKKHRLSSGASVPGVGQGGRGGMEESGCCGGSSQGWSGRAKP